MKVTHEVILEYNAIKSALTMLKKQESEMRIEILESVFDSSYIGTVNTTVGDWAVKGSFKNNYRLDGDEVGHNYDDMTEEEQECVNFKPTLVMKKYNALEPGSLLEQCITISPAMPTLVIKEIADD